MKLEVKRVDWRHKAPFRISYSESTHAETVMVQLRDGDLAGRGEASGVAYRGETAASLQQQLEGLPAHFFDGLTRENLQERLPAGGARNALDCALWDLDAKRAGKRAWELAGIDEVKVLRTAFTLSLDTPAAMAKAAAEAAVFDILKLKLGGEGDIDRVSAVRDIRPEVEIIVDANQAWRPAQLESFVHGLADLGVLLIEQPLPAGDDVALRGFESPIPICADESIQTASSLADLADRYQFINIKLDKTGGLTEALRLADQAKALDLGLMTGCMMGSSLAMAPAFVVAQRCAFVDLDGPLWSSTDIANAIDYRGSDMFPPSAQLWG
ncbi:N-acetyl-D-Glu racemase DgcA [Sphingosinicella xenopeptidilytica]|uniref:Dipeptide epimerase n=1 Tax=Sphingosinicella xenopeptidilytica TaxID=364098 RepID=A0ABW3C4D7_SPHXN